MNKLSDEQWEKIEKVTGLPSEARSFFESLVAIYFMQFVDSTMKPAEIRGKLRGLRNQAEDLLKGFEDALSHRDVLVALGAISHEFVMDTLYGVPDSLETARERDRLSGYHRTDKVKADLKALIVWLEESERALPRGNPGRPADQVNAVHLFLDWFDHVLYRYTNERLKRSKRHRRMIEEVFAILDRDVGPGTIETAMRRVRAARKSTRKISARSHIVNKHQPA
jgi:hypothetical protein